MNCEAARKSIALSLDGELEKSKIPALQKHLSGCPACSDELGLMKGARAIFQKTSRERAEIISTTGLEERVLKLVALGKSKRQWSGDGRWFALRLALPFGVVLLFLSLLFLRQHNVSTVLENYLSGDLHSLTSSFYTDLVSAR